MSDSLINTLTPTTAPTGAVITAVGAVDATSGSTAVKVPMSTLRNADGTDAMAALTAGGTASSSVATATGAQADTAYSGTGSTSVIGALKGIFAKLAGTLTVSGPLTDTQLRATPVYTVTKGLEYTLSTINSSTAQLGAGDTFTGTIETTFNQPAAQVMVTCDQAYTVYIDQYNGTGIASGLIETTTFTRTANQGTNENIMLKGDFLRVRVTNNGGSTTTTFNLETTYGQLITLPTSTSNKGNLKTSIEEFNAPSLPLPTGAATETTLNAVKTALGTPLQAGGNVAVTASVLPTGAATAANQATEISSLSSIDTKFPAQVSGSLPVNLSSFSFAQSTANVTTTQLGAGATWNGSIETAFNQQGIQIMCNADQPYTITVTQYQDLAGTKPLGTSSFTRTAGIPTNETLQVNGNFVRVSVTNNGTATTTTFFVDTTYGPLSPFPTSLSNGGNFKVALTENTAGLATDANIKALTQHLAITNILLSQMMDSGKTPLLSLYNDPTLTSY